MRKKLIIVTLFLLTVLTEGFCGDRDLSNVPKDFVGTYVPVAFEMQLKELMNYEKALNDIAPTNYDLLMLRENVCYTTLRFWDGYAVLAKDFEKWTFVNGKDGQYILDENGCSYRKISDDGSYEGYTLFAEHALKILFRDAIHNKNISINKDKVNLYGKEYEIKLDPTYSSKDFIVALNNGAYFLVKDGLGAKLVEGISSSDDKWQKNPGDKVVLEIPLFFWRDEEYPEIRNIRAFSLDKKNLRILRNIFYAKHGYEFKSQDLKEIFEAFDWYKPNPNFSEKNFSNYENAMIHDIQGYESK
ncbi:MAG: YARHG domain-containing protein [Treponema sp.]|nr:YARHG domain-containing protein [Treponema sp.]